MTALAQQGGQRQRARNAAPGPPHDPHDLSGIWLGRAVGALNNPAPVYTAAGKAAFDANNLRLVRAPWRRHWATIPSEERTGQEFRGF